MSSDKKDDDVIRVAAGEMVTIEHYKQELEEAGIEARVLGEALAASFGSALQQSVELWVHRGDAARAEEIIQGLDSDHHSSEERKKFPHPVSDPNPQRKGGHGPHTHYNANP